MSSLIQSPVTLRFAPSPTGYLHVGNLRLAIFNWLFARKHTGTVLLRFDDTDAQRSKDKYMLACKDVLGWLGLQWNTNLRQSNRYDRYQTVISALRDSGQLYPCFESQEELALQRRLQRQRGQPPVYNRASLRLSGEECQARVNAGGKPHWRFRLDADRVVTFNDLARGKTSIPLNSQSDPVLIREDGQILYTLSSVIDDIDFAISHIVRGEDHVVNTAVQIALFESIVALLGIPNFTLPQFAHMSLIVSESGKPLSKRDQSLSLDSLRSEGIEPETLLTYLVAMGGNQSPIDFEGLTETITTSASAPYRGLQDCLDRLAKRFDFSYYSKNTPRFHVSALRTLNKRRLSLLPFSAIEAQRKTLKLETLTEAQWLLLRGEIDTMADIVPWLDRLTPGQRFQSSERTATTIIKSARDILEGSDWDEAVISKAIHKLPAQTDTKPGQCFHALRYGLLGQERGPGLVDVIMLLGRDECLSRLEAASGHTS